MNFKFANNSVYVYTTSREDFENIIDNAEKSHLAYFTHTPIWNKTKSIVLKGIPKCEDEMIIQDLEKHNIKCVKINIIKKKKDPMPQYPVRILTLEHNTDLKKVKAIRNVCFTRVRWEDYHNKKGITQCHRCQNFGHAAKNCHMEPKCVKCGKSHITSVCMKKLEETSYCCNCGGDHPASYNNCPELLKILERNVTKRAPITKSTIVEKRINMQEFPPLKNHWQNEKEKDKESTIQNNTEDIVTVTEILKEIKKLKQVYNLKRMVK